MQTPPPQVASGAHCGRRRTGLRQRAAPQEHGNLLGVETVVLGFAPVDGLHVLGVAQHKCQTFLGAQVGQPGPGQHALYGDPEILAIRSNRLEKAFGARGHIPVEPDLSVSVDDTDVHCPGMQIDATVGFVHSGVESHEPSSS
jgi:hypothetical protein